MENNIYVITGKQAAATWLRQWTLTREIGYESCWLLCEWVIVASRTYGQKFSYAPEVFFYTSTLM